MKEAIQNSGSNLEAITDSEYYSIIESFAEKDPFLKKEISNNESPFLKTSDCLIYKIKFQDQDAGIIIIQDRNKLPGFPTNEWVLVATYIDSKMRSNGIYSKIMNETIEMAKKSKVNKISFISSLLLDERILEDKKKQLKEFYNHLGFTEDNDYYELNIGK